MATHVPGDGEFRPRIGSRYGHVAEVVDDGIAGGLVEFEAGLDQCVGHVGARRRGVRRHGHDLRHAGGGGESVTQPRQEHLGAEPVDGQDAVGIEWRTHARRGHQSVEGSSAGLEHLGQRSGSSVGGRQVGDHLGVAQVDADDLLATCFGEAPCCCADTRRGSGDDDRAHGCSWFGDGRIVGPDAPGRVDGGRRPAWGAERYAPDVVEDQEKACANCGVVSIARRR